MRRMATKTPGDARPAEPVSGAGSFSVESVIDDVQERVLREADIRIDERVEEAFADISKRIGLEVEEGVE